MQIVRDAGDIETTRKLLLVALQTEIHIWIEGQIHGEIASVHLMAADAGHGRAASRIDDLFANRVRTFVSVGMARIAQVYCVIHQILCVVGFVRSVTRRALKTRMGDVLLFWFGMPLFLEVATHTERSLFI